MTSLINLMIASFLAMGAPAPAAHAATATPAPPAGKSADAMNKAAFKQMLDDGQKVNDICKRDNFGKACIAAQEDFQRKVLKYAPQGATTGMPSGFDPKQAAQGRR